MPASSSLNRRAAGAQMLAAPLFAALLFAALLAADLWSVGANAASPKPEPLATGAASIVVDGAAPDRSAITVFTYRPANLAASAPLVIVMHGVERNAAAYRNNWIATAEKYRFLVAVPEMSRQQFPGGRGYNRGNMFDKDNHLLPKSAWAWRSIEIVPGVAHDNAGMTDAAARWISNHAK